jgi:hypothetical protein
MNDAREDINHIIETNTYTMNILVPLVEGDILVPQDTLINTHRHPASSIHPNTTVTPQDIRQTIIQYHRNLMMITLTLMNHTTPHITLNATHHRTRPIAETTIPQEIDSL